MRIERELRESYQQREGGFRHDVVAAQDRLELLRIEHQNALQLAAKRDSQTKREYEASLSSLNSRVAELEAENQQLLVKSKAELSAKTQELTEKYTNCLNEVENVTLGTAMKKAEAEKRAAVVHAQHQWARDAEEARKFMQQQHKTELENVHEVYRQRETQTAHDLQLLENAYNSRIHKLENQVSVYREQAAAATRTLDKFKMEQMREVSCLKEETHAHVARLHQQQERVQELQRSLEHAHHLNQEVTAQELAYREQCRRLLEEQRLQKGALQQTQQCVQQLTAELAVYKRQAKQHNIADSALAMSLQISQQESVLNEHELRRIVHENKTLHGIVSRSDSIVYGSQRGAAHPPPAPAPAARHDATLSARYTAPGSTGHPRSAPSTVAKGKLRSAVSCQLATHSITKPLVRKLSSVAVGRSQQTR